MGISVFERRKFVRLEASLAGKVNNERPSIIKNLSLGGCLLETSLILHLKETIQIDFSVAGEAFGVGGRVMRALGQNQYAIRFENQSNENNIRLVKAIEKIHETENAKRQTRIQLKQKAALDREPALLTNLSEGGCFLQTTAPFNTNDIVEVKFKLEKDEFHLAGQIRWVHSKGVGVEYLSPEPSQIDNISDFIKAQTTS